MKESGYISVIIYHNKSDANIIKCIKRIDRCLHNFSKYYEIIIVCDGYNQDTIYNQLKEVKDDLEGHVIMVDLGYKHGLEKAIQAGVDICIGDYIFEIESVEVSRSIEYLLMDMYKKLIEEKCDIVFGVTKQLRAANSIYRKLMKKRINKEVNIGNQFIRLVTRRALNQITSSEENHKTRNLQYQLCGFQSSNIIFSGSTLKIKTLLSNINKELLYFFSLGKLGFKITFIVGLTYSAFLLLSVHSKIFIEGQMLHDFILPILLFGFTMLFFAFSITIKYLSLSLKGFNKTKLYTVKKVRRLK